MTLTPILARLTGALAASLLLLFVCGAAVAAAADIGHKDFAAGGDAITGSKPESKLWFNDGFWWASMSSTSPAGFYIYRLDPDTEDWVRTTTALDPRSATRADTLWDGTKLYVASQQWEEDGGATGSGTSFETRLYRYSYDSSTDTYTLDVGFPASIRTGIQSETLVIAKDSTGALWATWTQQSGTGQNTVYTNHTMGNDATWSVPEALPVGGAALTAIDDISSIIAFTVSGEERIGVFWSNQRDDRDYFAWHVDGVLQATWTVETAVTASGPDPHPADDHMNLKTDSSGRVYAVTKTSNTGSSQPFIQLLTRTPAGAWSAAEVADFSESNTRAILQLDTSTSRLHVFMTGPHIDGGSGQSGGDIYEKTSPTSAISFPAGAGTRVIRDDDSSGLNDATSTKQNVNETSGIVVLAFNDDTDRYWHHHRTFAPDAEFTGTPTSGPSGLDVVFTNTSTGTAPLTYAWNFGDPASGASNTSALQDPTHTYDSPGTYTVKLTATNTADDNTKTRTGYVTVLPPPVADFTGAPTSGTSPLTVDFTNTSTGTAPLTYAWDFGDPDSGASNTSTSPNPTHPYNPGTYTVSLTVSNAGGIDTRTRTGYVTVSAPPGSRFFSIDPVRVLDTRSNLGLTGALVANAGRTFKVADGTLIPADAVAVTGNLTVTGQTRGGYVVLAPAGGSSTSTINFPVRDTRANGVTVALGANGTLNAIYRASGNGRAHVLFDVTGYFRGGAGGATFHSVGPVRVLDSRVNLGLTGVFGAGTARSFTVADGTPIPADAVAVTGNITVTGQTKGGYIVLAPAAGGSTSTINFPVGDTRANGVTIALGAGGTLNAMYRAAPGSTTHIVFDVTGYFLDGTTGSSFFTLTPVRVLDSRIGLGLSNGFVANAARNFTVADGAPVPTNAVAVTGNVTVTGQTRGGYIVLAPTAGGSTSTINFPRGDTRANGVTVALGSAGRLNAMYKSSAGARTDIVLDVTGYFR